MKKGGKVLLTMGIATTVAMGTIGITNITNMQKEEDKATIQAYNHTPANILDNVFTLNNNKYLPFIFNDVKEVVTKTQVEQEFTKAGLEIEKIEKYNQGNGYITTGTTIKVKGSSDVYTVVIYGDADGDGEVNVFDALRIVEHIATNNKITGTAFQLAANVENADNTLDVFDALRIVGVIAGEVDKLVLEEPEANPDPGPGPTPGDTEKPTISIGQPVISVNFGDNYQDNDNDVTANDNVDGDLTAKVVREKIEFIPQGSSQTEIVTTISTDRIGTYKIFYKVSDSSGNTENSTRTITVKGLSSIKIGHGNQELNLSELDLHIEKPVGDNDVEESPTDHNVYTIVPITFYDQNGTQIELKATDIQINPAKVTDGKLGIDLSKVNTSGNEVVLVNYYDENDNIVAKNNTTTNIKKIGFAMSLQGQAKPDVSQLNGKEITFKCREKEINLPITVTYKTLQNLDINVTTDVTTLGQNQDGNYVPRVNEEFTLGIIEIGELEQPITQAMIDQGDVSFVETIDSNKLDLWYELDSQGRVLLKGNVKTEEAYTITPKVGSIVSKTSIKLKGMIVDKDLNISIGAQDEYSIKLVGDDDSLYMWEEFAVNGTAGPQEIQLKDIDVVQKVSDSEVNYLNISFSDEDGNELTEALEKVKAIYIDINQDAGLTQGQLPIDVMVTITIFDGLKGIETSKTIMLHIS